LRRAAGHRGGAHGGERTTAAGKEGGGWAARESGGEGSDALRRRAELQRMHRMRWKSASSCWRVNRRPGEPQERASGGQESGAREPSGEAS